MNSSSKQIIYNQELVSLLLVSVIACLSYWPVMGYYFTTADVFPLIEFSQIHSFNDFFSLWAKPLMDQIHFDQDYFSYYRPIVSLSFAWDYMCWGLNEKGYHLTNLILHILNTQLLWLFVYILFDKNKKLALISALIFTMHPVLVHTVGAVARRQEILVSIFILMTMIMLIKNKLFFSYLFFLFSLLTKESAVILIFIIPTCLILIKGQHKGYSNTLKTILPYGIIFLLFLINRFMVLGNLGGASLGLSQVIQKSFIYFILEYFLSWIYPIKFLNINKILLFIFEALIIGLFLWGVFKSTDSYKTKKKMIWVLSWVLFYLIIYLMTVIRLSPRYMYLPAVPLSIGSAYFFMRLFKYRVFVRSFCVLLLIQWIIFSPILYQYGGWEKSGEWIKMFFKKLSLEISDIPTDSDLNIENIPYFLNYSKYHVPRIKYGIRSYSVESWIRLKFPEKNLNVKLKNRTNTKSDEPNFHLETIQIDPMKYQINVV